MGGGTAAGAVGEEGGGARLSAAAQRNHEDMKLAIASGGVKADAVATLLHGKCCYLLDVLLRLRLRGDAACALGDGDGACDEA